MLRFLFSFLLLSLLLSIGCRKERFTTDPVARLRYSVDTLSFDTVFQSVGSATENFQVINDNKDGIRMDIRLAGGESSPFRINIDGRATTHFADYELAGHDSLYIFIDVTIHPQNDKVLVLDSVLFDYNGHEDKVILAAIGQDVHLLSGEYVDCNAVWANDKPYLLYNSVGVRAGCTLTIDPGVKVYSHKGSALFVWGQLIVNGTVDDPVVFSGDRLEKKYAHEAGQWAGIFLLPGSTGNTITHAIIENADIAGIQVDSLPTISGGYNLRIEKSIIRNIANVGLWGNGAAIDARNVLIHSCGQATFAGDSGGKYDLTNCTFDDSYSSAARKNPSIFVSNRDIAGHPFNPLHAYFRNCILWGTEDDEVGFNFSGHGAIDTSFRFTLVKVKETQVQGSSNIRNQSPRFKNYQEGDYRLDSLSPAVNAGIFFPPPFDEKKDLLEKPRIDLPDLGCFERE